MKMNVLKREYNGKTKEELMAQYVFGHWLYPEDNTVDIFCPHCMKRIAGKEVYEGEINKISGDNNKTTHYMAMLVKCPHCGEEYYVAKHLSMDYIDFKIIDELTPFGFEDESDGNNPENDVFTEYSEHPEYLNGKRVYLFCDIMGLQKICEPSYALQYDEERNRILLYRSVLCPYLNGKKLFFKVYKSVFATYLDKRTSYYAFVYPGVERCQFVNCTHHISQYTDTLPWLAEHPFLHDFIDYLVNYYNIPDALISQLKETVDGNNKKADGGFDTVLLKFVLGYINAPNCMARYDEYRNEYMLNRTEYYQDKTLYTKGKDIFPKDLKDSMKFAKEICRKYGLPSSKAFTKYYMEDSANLSLVLFLKRIGFKKADNYLKVLKEKLPEPSQYNGVTYREYTGFLRDMTKRKGENRVATLLHTWPRQRDFNILDDTVSMYRQVKAWDKSFITESFFDGTLREMHDRLIPLIHRLEYKNAAIPYSEKEKKYETDINGYSFRLAKDTNELIVIGQEMGICVGSYRQQALNKSCTILDVQHQGRYAACIEVAPDKRVKQIKGKYNRLLNGDIANAVREWVRKTRMITKHSYDFENMDIAKRTTGDIDYDYHYLELQGNDVVNVGFQF